MNFTPTPRSAFLGPLLLFAVATGDPPGVAPLAAQSPDIDALRSYLVDGFERQKALDVAYVEAMPDSAWRWAPSDAVRDYATQIAHITHDFFLPWRDDGGPSADSTAYLNDKAVMLEQVRQGYDWAMDYFAGQSDDELTEVVDFFGGRRLPRWQTGTYWLEHAMWTRGTVVPYLRAHGVTPPPVRFF